MARAVYSTQFLCFGGVGAQSESYTVPSGFVAVLRDVTTFIEGTSGQAVELYVSPQIAFIAYTSAVAGDVVISTWSGRVVLDAGQQIIASGTAATALSLIASGYLLAL